MKWKSFKTVQILQVIAITVELLGTVIMFCNIKSGNIIGASWIGLGSLDGAGVWFIGYLIWQYGDHLEWEVVYE